MRVGFLTTSLLLGGAERWMVSLIKHFPIHKISVSGLVLSEFSPSEDSMIREFSRYVPVCGTTVPNEGLNSPILRRVPREDAIREIFSDVDLVIAWGVGPLESQLEGYSGPVLFVLHGGCEWTKKIAIQAAPRVSHWSAVSRWAARVCPAENCKIVHNGVDLSRIVPSCGREETRSSWGYRFSDRLVGYLGRLSLEKNPVAAAIAVSRLPAEYHAVYIGDGWQRDAIREDVIYHARDRNKFVGVVDKVGDALRGLDCLIAASKSEGFSLAIVESWLAKVPVISTQVGAIPELEEQFDQLVIPIPVGADGSTLADAVLQSRFSSAIVDRAYKLACDQFTDTAMAKRWVAYLRGL